LKYFRYKEFTHILQIQCNLSQPNLLGTNICVQNRQVFGLYRLNKQKFPTWGLYLKFGLYRISVYSEFGLYRISVYSGFGLIYRISIYSGFSLDRFHCVKFVILILIDITNFIWYKVFNCRSFSKRWYQVFTMYPLIMVISLIIRLRGVVKLSSFVLSKYLTFFEYDFHTCTPKLSNQNKVCLKSNVLIGSYLRTRIKSWSKVLWP